MNLRLVTGTESKLLYGIAFIFEVSWMAQKSTKKASTQTRKQISAQKRKPKERKNTGRDSKGAATGPIIRTLPQTASDSGGEKAPRRRTWLKRIVFTVAVFLFVGAIYLVYKARVSVIVETGTIKIEGLISKVTIARDSLGVAYVKADTEEDAFFGAGYAAATDRLWQMYSTKLAVTGRLAEIGGSKMLPVDVYMRTVGVARNVDRAIRSMDAKHKKPLEAYAAGVNAFLKTHKNLPIEFTLTGYTPEPWTIEDCGYAFGALAFGLAININEELFFLDAAKKLGPEKAAYLVPTYQDEPIPFAEAQKIDKKLASLLTPHTEKISSTLKMLNEVIRVGMPASNNWVVGGEKTKSGKAIVANDTHLPITMPSIWSMMNIESPTYKAAGVTIAGLPYIQLGYNGKIAWGATMVEADCQDLFIETLRMQNGQTQFLRANNTWSPVRERKEHFKVRFGRDRDVVLRFTANGPLVSDALNQLDETPHMSLVPVGSKTSFHIAMRWSLQDGDNAGAGIYEMGRAQTMEGFRRALSRIHSMYLNIVYSDGENIAWQTTGRIPVRSKGTGQLPSVAADGYRWKAFLPFERQPHKENPKSGYLVTANERTVPKGDTRHISGVWYSPERAERITDVLSKRSDWDGEETKKLQLDLYSRMAEKTLFILNAMERNLKEAIQRLPTKKQKRAKSALEILSKFDNVMAKDSKGAALISAFYYTFTRNVFGDELGIDSSLWKNFIDTNLRSYNAPQDHVLGRDESPFFDDIRTEAKESKADMLALSLADAYEFCEDAMGSPDKWRWGKLHKIYWRSDITKDLPLSNWYFNYGPVAYQGDSHTVNVAHYAWGENFETFVIPAMRLVVDFGKIEPVELIVHSGVSGHPSSKHYNDQIKYFLEGKNHPLPIRDAAKSAQYTKILTLEKK
ncbi:MAG: Acyl-homoserine lactone acylase QuiP [Turneriella sp.]|nr:Acyl-homoserine lactone acylase QuiP [Turneriella sp.]